MAKESREAKEKRTYSTGCVFELGDGKWLLRVSAGTGLGGRRIRPSRTIYAKSKSAAERELKKFLAEIDGRVSNDTLTVRQLYEIFKEDKLSTLEESTQLWYERLFRRINGALGHIVLHDLRPKDIEKFYGALADPKKKAFYRDPETKKEYKNGLSGESILHHHRALSACLTWAYKNSLMDRKIIDRVSPPTSDTKKKRALTKSEIDALQEALKTERPVWQAYFTLALATGMRREELCALEWNRVNFDANTIRVKRAMKEVRGGNKPGATKTRGSNRTIKVSKTAMAQLKAWRAKQLEECVAWPEPWDGEYVFTSESGKPIALARCSNKAKKLFKKAGIVEASLHTLRHTCVTYLLSSGIPANEVAAYVGHSSAKMTLDVYGHAAEDYASRCAEEMSTLLKIGQ